MCLWVMVASNFAEGRGLQARQWVCLNVLERFGGWEVFVDWQGWLAKGLVEYSVKGVGEGAMCWRLEGAKT